MTRRSVLLALLATVSLAGCASLDEAARLDLVTGQSALAERPAEALERARRVQARYPELAQAHALAARALEQLEQHGAANQAWQQALAARRADALSEREAYEGVLRTTRALWGDLPSLVTIPADSALRSLGEACLRACNQLLDEDPAHRIATLMKCECLLRLGRAQPALSLALEWTRARPADGAGRYLLSRIKEQQIGVHTQALETYQDLLRDTDDEVRRQAALHLIHLLPDPGLTSLDRDNVRGNLQRLARMAGAPAGVIEWQTRHETSQQALIEARRLARQITEAQELRQRGDHEQGWGLLSELPNEDPSVRAAREHLLTSWAQTLIDSTHEALAAGHLETAREHLDRLGRLPGPVPSDETRTRAEQARLALTRAEWQQRVATVLEEARAALTRADPHRCLELLDELPAPDVPADLRALIGALRAEALWVGGQGREALDHLEDLGVPEDPRTQRLYGILLADQRRSQQAQQVLEALPLGYLTGEALEALLETLVQQGAWDAVLVRLVGMEPLGEAHRRLRRRAALEACRASLARHDGAAAVRLLFGHLDTEDRKDPAVWELGLVAMLQSNQLDTAREHLRTRDPQHTFTTPGVAQQVHERLAGALPEVERFALLQTLERSAPGLCKDTLADLWPRQGSYLPVAGDHVLTYQLIEHGAEGESADPTRVEFTLRWQGDRFVLLGPDETREEWRVEGGVWKRATAGGEHEIPVRVSAGTPLPARRYLHGEERWSAEIIEVGQTVTLAGREYPGCLRVRWTPVDTPGETIFLDLAPGLGEIRRQVYAGSQLRFTRELVQCTPPVPGALVHP